VGVGLGICTGN